MVAAEQVAPLPAAVAGVVVGGPAAPPDVSHQLPTALLHLLGLRRRQQRLDLLGTVIQMGFHVWSDAIKADTCVLGRICRLAPLQHSRLVRLAATCGLHY